MHVEPTHSCQIGRDLISARARVKLRNARVKPEETRERSSRHPHAAGLTNREVAKAAFVSPKTVEANLARVYRKLGIHSRAELGTRMHEFETQT